MAETGTDREERVAPQAGSGDGTAEAPAEGAGSTPANGPESLPADPDALRARIAEREEELERLRSALERWEERTGAVERRDVRFTTVSGREVKSLYTPLDRADAPTHLEALGLPGEPPFTRGPYHTMYRTRLWTQRQFSGFGTVEETNRRYHYLLEHGQTGLSVAFDFPTLMGYDSDHPRAEGEVGICGVAVSSTRDMETLFDGIPLDRVSVSMTINGPALILFAFYVAAAERQGADVRTLRGTVQNDILKEYQAQHAWIFPAEPALRCIVDMFDWCTRNAPRYNPISISGYHIREAGATAVQELAFTLANGFEYVERAVERGLIVDEFAPRLSFFFDVHNDLFEEVAKLRAARRIWARTMEERFGATTPEARRLRTHAQTAGVTLTAQQPENNVVRVAYQALAAVLGGTQSLHTNSMDETLALPTEKAVRIALRTQQILAHETGVPNVMDPLGGSWFVESLTDEMEEEAREIFVEIEEAGGVVPAIEDGWFQRRIAESAAVQQEAVDSGRRVVVGVNRFTEGSEGPEIEVLSIPPELEAKQHDRLERLRKERDDERVARTLDALEDACRGDANLVDPVLECARADCTLFEIRERMERVFGTFHEPISF